MPKWSSTLFMCPRYTPMVHMRTKRHAMVLLGMVCGLVRWTPEIFAAPFLGRIMVITGQKLWLVLRCFTRFRFFNLCRL